MSSINSNMDFSPPTLGIKLIDLENEVILREIPSGLASDITIQGKVLIACNMYEYEDWGKTFRFCGYFTALEFIILLIFSRSRRGMFKRNCESVAFRSITRQII